MKIDHNNSLAVENEKNSVRLGANQDNSDKSSYIGIPITPGMRIKVALFIYNSRIGGAERQALELAKHLDKQKFEVIVIVLYAEGELEEKFRSLPDLQLVILDGKRPIRALWGLVRLIRKSQIQVIHSFLTATNVYSLFARFFLRRVRIIIGLRDSMSELTFGCSSPLLRTKFRILDGCLSCLRRFGDLYVSNSEAGKTLYERKFGVQVTVVPNGIDIERFKPWETSDSLLRDAVRAPSDVRLVGILANCSVYKDYPTFVRAASIINNKHRNVHFVSIGDDRTPSGAEAKRLVQEMELRSVFHFMGTRKEVSELLPGLDVLCSSSATEGFSNSIAEAMACGVPCVVTDVGDSRRIVGDTGMVVPPGDPESLAHCVVTLLSADPAEKQRLSSAARQRILENFDVSLMAKNYERLYASLISESFSNAELGKTATSSHQRKSEA